MQFHYTMHLSLFSKIDSCYNQKQSQNQEVLTSFTEKSQIAERPEVDW